MADTATMAEATPRQFKKGLNAASRDGLVRSAGMADLLSSEAGINDATAYNKELDNNLKYVQTYFAVWER